MLDQAEVPNPLSLDEEWAVREVTLLGEAAAAAFVPFARHTGQADVVIVHRDDGDTRTVMLGWSFWLRVLATVAAANDYPIPSRENAAVKAAGKTR
jgi:hypothetical protein